MNGENKEKILKNINQLDYIKGINYCCDYISFNCEYESGNIKTFKFGVKSEDTTDEYQVVVTMSNGNIINTHCNCLQYRGYHSCKHIGACLVNYEDEIFKVLKTNSLVDKSNTLLNEFWNVFNQSNKPKELISLEIELNLITNRYNNKTMEVVFKIGKEKKYILKPKLHDFLRIYEDKSQTLNFGKAFTYDPMASYFSKEDEEIIEWLIDYHHNTYIPHNQPIILKDKKLLKFLSLLMNKPFYFNPYFDIYKIEKCFPFQNTLTKQDKTFTLDFNINKKELYILSSRCEYIIYQQKACKLDAKESQLLCAILNNNMDKMVFEEDKLPYFSKSILPIIKDNIILDKKIENDIIIEKAKVKLYFDLDKDQILCRVELLYKDIAINYFDNTNTNILRDIILEQEVIDELTNWGFYIKKEKIILDDIELIGEFLEYGLLAITDKWETFTSQKIDNIKKIEKAKISSNFSIGKDNIFNYSFDLNNISNKELDKIFDNLEKKKKYYKLKNGNIINLNDSSDLIELKSLMNDLDLNSDDLFDEGVLPKYRALYLDSLKNSKYSIINTNNMFDEFINNFKNNKNFKLAFTKKESDILRGYQEEGIRWLYNIHKCDFGGILADEMGLGKSVQTLYFIDRLLKEDKEAKILIVVPTSLVYNWENEIKKFTPHLTYKLLVGNKNERNEKFEDIKDKNILITTYGLLREDKEKYLKMNFKVFIIDEAQNIKNDNALTTKIVKKVVANTKIALTGTPIENSALELWSIFDFIMPGFLSNITKFNSKYKFNEFNDETNILLEGLNKLISPFILRRKKTDVLTELPEKLENNIFLELDDEQKKVYVAELKNVKEKMDEILNTEGFSKARFMILQLLTKLRQICIDPSIVFENYKGESNKLNVLLQVVEESVKNDHKILIFTSFKTALEIVRKKLNDINISTYTIDGSVSSKNRMNLVDKFNEDDTNVFLIMLKSGGTGLNLTSADVVIHLDMWWNPQSENQATDRTHRIGQKKVVEVIKLICKGTIEEKILELQKKKRILSDKLIEGDNRNKNNLSFLSEKDIKNLLSFENKDEN
ncbi:MAG: DEAD/DEAH box helicase [Bacilli bacterium]